MKNLLTTFFLIHIPLCAMDTPAIHQYRTCNTDTRKGLLFQIMTALNIPTFYNANITNKDRDHAGEAIKNFLILWRDKPIKKYLKEQINPYKKNHLFSRDPISVYTDKNNTKVIGKIILTKEEYNVICYMYKKIFTANIAILKNNVKIMNPKKLSFIKKNRLYSHCYELKFVTNFE